MFLDKIKATINKYRLVEPGDRIIVAVSGGADSVALLHALYTFAHEWGLVLRIAHLNHLIQERSFTDALFVQNIARDLNLPYTIASKDSLAYRREKKLSLQVAARELRYGFLMETARYLKFNKIALGHTADDQAETILMRLLRGSGLKGLSGIPPVRVDNSVRYIRPMLEITRQDIEKFLNQQNTSYVNDPSNLRPIYFRNKIRLGLMPDIKKEYNPNIVNTLIRIADVLREEEDLLEEMSQQHLPEMILEKGLESIILDKPKLLKLHPALQRRLLRRAIKEFQGGCYAVPALNTFNLLKIITRDNPGPASIHLPGGLIVKSDKSRITIRSKKKLPFHLLPERALEVPGNIHLPEYNLTFIARIKSRADISLEEAKENRFLAFLDFHKLKLPLKVRTRNLGDRFRPLGMAGRKKLKEFFIDYRVPREERDRIPLVVSAADILWVVGFQINDRVKISSCTTTVLEMRAVSPENGQNN